MPQLTVEGFPTVEVEAGKRLVLAIEQDAGVDILHACGGNARCTTCRVEFIDGEPRRMTGGGTARCWPQGRQRRPPVVPDPVRSRHDRPRHQPARRQRPPRTRVATGARDYTAAGVDPRRADERRRSPLGSRRLAAFIGARGLPRAVLQEVRRTGEILFSTDRFGSDMRRPSPGEQEMFLLVLLALL